MHVAFETSISIATNLDLNFQRAHRHDKCRKYLALADRRTALQKNVAFFAVCRNVFDGKFHSFLLKRECERERAGYIRRYAICCYRVFTRKRCFFHGACWNRIIIVVFDAQHRIEKLLMKNHQKRMDKHKFNM